MKFYTYSFFDIELAAVKVRNAAHCFSTEDLGSCLDWNSAENEIKSTGQQIFHGRVRVADRIFYGYSFPIIFGEEYLGFFTVFSSRRIGKLMQRMLADLENDFIDDQLVHVIRNEV